MFIGGIKKIEERILNRVYGTISALESRLKGNELKYMIEQRIQYDILEENLFLRDY